MWSATGPPVTVCNNRGTGVDDSTRMPRQSTGMSRLPSGSAATRISVALAVHGGEVEKQTCSYLFGGGSAVKYGKFASGIARPQAPSLAKKRSMHATRPVCVEQ